MESHRNAYQKFKEINKDSCYMSLKDLKDYAYLSYLDSFEYYILKRLKRIKGDKYEIKVFNRLSPDKKSVRE